MKKFLILICLSAFLFAGCSSMGEATGKTVKGVKGAAVDVKDGVKDAAHDFKSGYEKGRAEE